MKSDEVIDEIRSVREKLSAQYGHDIHKHLEHLREKESSSQQKVLKSIRSTSVSTDVQ